MTQKTKIVGTIFASALVLAGAAYTIKRANDVFFKNRLDPNSKKSNKDWKKDPNEDIDWSKV